MILPALLLAAAPLQDPWCRPPTLPQVEAALARLGQVRFAPAWGPSGDGTPLDRVARDLAELTGLEFFVSPGARADEDEATIILQLPERSVLSVLDILASTSAELRWAVVADGVAFLDRSELEELVGELPPDSPLVLGQQRIRGARLADLRLDARIDAKGELAVHVTGRIVLPEGEHEPFLPREAAVVMPRHPAAEPEFERRAWRGDNGSIRIRVEPDWTFSGREHVPWSRIQPRVGAEYTAVLYTNLEPIGGTVDLYLADGAPVKVMLTGPGPLVPHPEVFDGERALQAAHALRKLGRDGALLKVQEFLYVCREESMRGAAADLVRLFGSWEEPALLPVLALLFEDVPGSENLKVLGGIPVVVEPWLTDPESALASAERQRDLEGPPSAPPDDPFTQLDRSEWTESERAEWWLQLWRAHELDLGMPVGARRGAGAYWGKPLPPEEELCRMAARWREVGMKWDPDRLRYRTRVK